MVVPYPPGGVNDAVARVYADKLTAELGKTVLVDNRAGAATTVASNFVAKAAPDGYTIYAGGTSLIINPTLTGNVQYDPHKSFELVSLMSFTPFILHVNADFPAKNMAELIAHLKANPGKFNIASSGIGATNHMAAELFKARSRAQVHARALSRRRAGRPGRGRGQRADDVLGLARGQAVPRQQEDPRHRDLEPERSPAFPDIPTVAEVDRPAGFPGGLLAGHGGAGRHAQADRRQAAGGDRQGRRRSRGDRALQGPGRRDQELDAGGVQEFYCKEEKGWTTLIKEQGIKAE